MKKVRRKCVDCSRVVFYPRKRCWQHKRKKLLDSNNKYRRKRSLRLCKKCNKLKTPREFSKSKNASVWCLSCCSKNAKKWRKDNRKKWLKSERVRAKLRQNDPRYIAWYRSYWLMRKYKLSIEEFYGMLERQKGCCAICKLKMALGRGGLNVDHSHKTGKVHELICSRCNSMLGMAGENPAILISAVKYLKKHNVIGDDQDQREPPCQK